MTTQSARVPVQPSVEEPNRNRRLPSWFGPWELALLGLVLIVLVLGAVLVPYFATTENFSVTAGRAVGLSLMVVPMSWLIIAGEIDLSVASVFGASGVVFGLAIQANYGLFLAFVAGLAVGVVAGIVNGFFAVTLGLPALIVTVGTLGLFRGIAYILIQNNAVSTLPAGFIDLAQGNILGSFVPNTLPLLVIVVVSAGVILHRGSFGRKVFAVGSSLTVSRFSGIQVGRVKRILFLFSGIASALAGIIYTGYVSSANATNGTGLELSVIAIVLIGGVSIFGGQGSFLGVMLSLILVTALGSWMTLSYVGTDLQYTVTGLLMIGAVVVPALIGKLAARLRRSADKLPQDPKEAFSTSSNGTAELSDSGRTRKSDDHTRKG